MTTFRNLLSVAMVLCATLTIASDEIPGSPQKQPILLFGGDVYTMSGEVIRGGEVLFENGKIVAVGKDINGRASSASVQRIDCTGKRVYPALFNANSELGLIEIDAVRATRDQNEVGSVNPNVRAEVGVNPDSELIPVARSNGILLSVTAPGGGLISGTSAVLQLDGWTWEDMTLKSPVGMHVQWPRMAPARAWWMRDTERQQNQRRDEALKQISQTTADARAYQTAKQSNPQLDFDARWEAMIPLLEGKIPLIVEANDQLQIQSAVAFAAKEKLKLIIVGGYDAVLCADLLKKYDVPVIIDGVQRMPTRRGDDYDAAFTLPARLKEAGIRFCISADRRASMVRNLPYHAATAAAFGLSPDDAMKSITLWPAQILGVADRVGTIEPNKDATLIVCSGDILETPTQVERAFIQGREVDLSNKQTKLWEKYREKYKRLGLDK
ncbi:MAG: amidohydrolase family protein [Anaerolineae bacterium]|nr:amidohydrolase family protein [Phycisphaerae bacterium]